MADEGDGHNDGIDPVYTYPTYPEVKILALSEFVSFYLLYLTSLVGWNMGNAKPVGLNLVIPPKGGDFDCITFGLQESTWAGKSDDDSGCVQYLLAEIQDILTDDFHKVGGVLSFKCHS